jgi:lipoprotein-anchoring transpeptidase ErfK/SrfK
MVKDTNADPWTFRGRSRHEGEPEPQRRDERDHMSHLTDTTDVGRSGNRGRRVLLIVIAILAVLAVVLTGGAFAYAKSYEGKALPGTTVLGQDVSGSSAQDIQKIVEEKAGATEVTVDTDGTEETASLSDLGVEVDAKKTGEKAASHDGSLGEVVSSTWSGGRDVEPVVSVDEKAAAEYAASQVPKDRTKAVDAKVEYDQDAGTWNVSEARDGQGVDTDAFVSALKEKASGLTSFTLTQKVTSTSPKITTEEAESTKDSITKMLDQPMSVQGPDGATHTVSADRRSDWLSVETDDEGTGLRLAVDEDAVRDWVSARADEDAVEKKDGIEQVDEDGKVVKTIAEKTDGVKITNTDAVTEKLVAAMTGTSPLEAAFETKTVDAEMTKAKAPASEDDDEDSDSSDEKKDEDKKKDDKSTDGDDEKKDEEKSSDKPTGEKWIDVDLSAKTVTAYKGDTPVWGPRAMVDGGDGHETATGSYKIYLRYDKQDMTNGNYKDQQDPEYYNTKDVPWVQYWYRGYAFHGAPWRSSFGYSGSHGCINMPVSDAKWLYDWASIGTRVEVHH